VVGLDDGSVLVVGNALGLAVGSNVVDAETGDADGAVLRLAGGAVAMGAVDVGREVLNGAIVAATGAVVAGALVIGSCGAGVALGVTLTGLVVVGSTTGAVLNGEVVITGLTAGTSLVGDLVIGPSGAGVALGVAVDRGGTEGAEGAATGGVVGGLPTGARVVTGPAAGAGVESGDIGESVTMMGLGIGGSVTGSVAMLEHWSMEES
jgi:hypothetical protein